MNATVTLTMANKEEITMDLNEAKHLYEFLDKMFGREYYSPYYKEYAPYIDGQFPFPQKNTFYCKEEVKL